MKARRPCYSLLQRTAIVLALALLSLSIVSYASASLEYLYLTGRGKSMYPAIKDGDVVKVKVCTDGDLINVGDIIVYSVIVTNDPHPDYMWIGHRVIERTKNGETWWFKTKGDNNSEPDSWAIPDYFLLGIVVETNPTKFTFEAEPTAAPRISSSTEKAPVVETTLPSIIEKIATMILIGTSVLLFLRTGEEEFKRHNREKQHYSGVEDS